MAREHARIWLDINSDDDFERLPFDAQGFYTRVILTLDDLNYCGVASWRPKRLTTKAPDLTVERILQAATCLEVGLYCLFDLDTEEVLARSFIRRDELLRNPKMAAAVIKAYNGVASKTLRAAIVTEIRRVHKEHPEYSSWTSKDTAEGLARLLARPSLDDVHYTNAFTNPNTNGITNRITNANPVQNTNGITNSETVPITETHPGPDYQSDSVPIPSTYTSTPTPAPLEGYVSTEGHHAHNPNNPPPPRYCPHVDDPHHPAKCGDCRAQRIIFDRWLTTQDVTTKERIQAEQRATLAARETERQAAEETRLAAIHNCPLGCDEDGYLGATVCDHNPDRQTINARGRALVQAALKRQPTDNPDPPEPEILETNPEEPPY
jgi:hypothetical protein